MSKQLAILPEMKDNPLLGIGLMLSFCAVIPFGDALVKHLGQTVPVMTLLVIRYLIQVLMMGTTMIWQKRGIGHVLNYSKRAWWCLFWRTAMHILGIIGMYYGLKYMPLADTTAIAFIFPILMLFVGHFYLKEQVGPHRAIAAIVGFIGTLLVVQPNFVAVGLNALWPVGVAFTFVIFMLSTRQMSREVDPISIQAVSGAMALMLVAVPLLLLNGKAWPLWDLVEPTAQDWPFLIMAGIIGSVGHLLMSAAIRFAPSATLAPMQYLEIPFATLIGWVVFSDLPNQLAAFGILVTVASGLYIIYREQQAQRAEKRDADKQVKPAAT
nr:DMT family transporter [uncultured Cohaesibacter sp.]